jgi:mRNA-degrading endonuclease YafQ of YafQ-DinJ toxin-antitoxin module
LSNSSLEFKTTRTFDKSFAALPPNIQEHSLEKLTLYENKARHPSLRVKKLEGTADIWEMSVTRNYRITFQREGKVVLLRNIGTHDILRRKPW